MNGNPRIVITEILPANADIRTEHPQDNENSQWIALPDRNWARISGELVAKVNLSGATNAEIYFNKKELRLCTKRAGTKRSDILKSPESLALQDDLLDHLHRALLTCKPRILSPSKPNINLFPDLEWSDMAGAPERLDSLTKHRKRLAHQAKPIKITHRLATGAPIFAELSKLPRTASTRIDLHCIPNEGIERIRWTQMGDMDVPWGVQIPKLSQTTLTPRLRLPWQWLRLDPTKTPNLSNITLTLEKCEPRTADRHRRCGGLLMVLAIAQCFNHIHPRPKRDIRLEVELRCKTETLLISLLLEPGAWALSFPACCLDPNPDKMPAGMTFALTRKPNLGT